MKQGRVVKRSGAFHSIAACAFVLLASPTVSTSCASRVAMRATCEIRGDVGRYGEMWSTAGAGHEEMGRL